MNKFSTPKKELYNRIATIVMVVFMFIWTIGSLFGIMAFFRPKDDTVKASAMTSMNDNLPYCYYIQSGTEFTLTEDFSGGFSDFFTNVEYIPMVLLIADYAVPVVLVDVDNWPVDFDYQYNVLPVYNVGLDYFTTATDFYFFTYQDLSYLADNYASLEISDPVNVVTYRSNSSFYEYTDFQDLVDVYYARGFDEGEVTGYSNGITAGYQAGRQTGYEIGFNAGIESANDYSFSSLIGAVIDVPVSAFQGLFNFEILGINIAGFLLSLMTIGLIVALVRFIM